MERNKSKLITGIVLLAIGIGLLYWALSGSSADAPAVQEAPRPQASEEQAVSEVDADEKTDEVTIVFTEEGFSPQEVTVAKGAVVRVQNNSSQRVQFSSDDHPTHRLNEGMNLPILAPGESDTFIAQEAGEWGFHDHINASFVGTLTVSEESNL